MAFTPEDGTGLAGSTSLVSTTYADAYWADRPRVGAAYLAATNAERQEALLRATDKLCARSWKGSPLSGTQALCLPRYWPTIDGRTWGGMPDPILKACCELANEDLSSVLDASEDRGGEVVSETIGPLSFDYSPTAPSGKTYPRVEGLIGPFLDEGGDELELA